jgi:hypothetical protein
VNRIFVIFGGKHALPFRVVDDLKQAGVQGNALYPRLGGYSAFKHRVDFQTYSDQMLAAKKAAYS